MKYVKVHHVVFPRSATFISSGTELILYIRKDIYDSYWKDDMQETEKLGVAEFIIDTLSNKLLKNRLNVESLLDATLES